MNTRNKTVAILGCGPAGLIAAHMAKTAGYEPKIFSIPKPSDLYGCQYLHAPIPNLTFSAPVIVSYDRIGTVEQYRRKVYGAKWKGDVSTQTLTREHPAWDIREAYERLWDDNNALIEPYLVTHDSMGSFPKNEFAFVFSSIPATALCVKGKSHSFESSHIYAYGETPTRKIEMDDFSIGNNHVLCNGLDAPLWYRVSRVFGYGTVEWSISNPPSESGITGSSLVEKPLSNDCTCFPDIIRIGRYGRWEKGILTHHAAEQVWEVLR